MKKSALALVLFSSFCSNAFALIDSDSPKTIVADKIEYNSKTKSVSTVGNAEITNTAGQRITLQDSHFSNQMQEMGGQNVDAKLGNHLRLSADNVVKDGELTVARHAVYTACDDCDSDTNAWEVSASKVVHSEDDMTFDFTNPVVWLYGIPIFWSPFMEYPDPRLHYKTGLLPPYFNSTNSMGTQINIPLYISISDTHDLTLTTSYLTKENPLFQLEHRLNAEHSSFRTTGSYTHNKAELDRWHVFNNDLIELGEQWRLSLFIQRASDKTYLQKYRFYDDQPYLESGAKLEFFASNGYVTSDAIIFQELRSYRQNQTKPSGNILPQIHSIYQTDPLFAKTYLSIMGDVQSILNSDNGTSAQRAIGEVEITSPWIIGYNKVTANLSGRYDIYNFTNTAMIDGPSDYSGVKTRVLPSGYLDWQMPFVKTGENWSNVIAPRARLALLDHQNTPAFANTNDSSGALMSDAVLFSNNRLSGYDVWENGNYLDYGADWSVFSNGGISSEVFLGQSYDLTERVDTDPNSGFHSGASDWVGRISFDTGKWVNLTNRFRFAENDFTLRHLETIARFGTRNYIDLGYIYATQFLDAKTLERTNQEAVGGFGVYLTSRLSFRANTTYNIIDQRVQKQSAGLYYDHPCYITSIEYARNGAQRFEEQISSTSIKFQFSMKLNGDQHNKSEE